MESPKPEETRVEFAHSDELYGEWYTCLECGENNIFRNHYRKFSDQKFNYCPDCGLKIIWE